MRQAAKMVRRRLLISWSWNSGAAAAVYARRNAGKAPAPLMLEDVLSDVAAAIDGKEAVSVILGTGWAEGGDAALAGARAFVVS